MGEKTGKYVKHGDVEEWEWDGGSDPGGPQLTGGWVVPEGEFDPRSASADVTSPSEKVMEAVSTSAGLQVAEQPAEPEGDEPEPEPEPAPKKTTKKAE